MSSARQDIMDRLKAGTKPLRQGLAPGPIPRRGQAEGPARIAMFVKEAEYAKADVVRLKAVTNIPQEMRRILAHVEAVKIKAAPHPDLMALDWAGVDIAYGRGVGDDRVGLSVAYAGVAETGTLVMRSGADAPTTLNFLPDVHVVVVRAADLEANYEAVWARLGADGERLPRTVNWITGPSRTADIEQTMLLGAHGPRKLIILLVDEKN